MKFELAIRSSGSVHSAITHEPGNGRRSARSRQESAWREASPERGCPQPQRVGNGSIAGNSGADFELVHAAAEDSRAPFLSRASRQLGRCWPLLSCCFLVPSV